MSSQNQHRTRRIIVAISVVLVAAVSSAVWALTFGAPYQVIEPPANMGTNILFSPTMGMITNIVRYPTCDSNIMEVLAGNELSVNGGGWPNGLHQCNYNVDGTGGSAQITASFLVSGGGTLSVGGGSQTIDLGSATVGQATLPKSIKILNSTSSTLTGWDLGFQNGTGEFQFSSPCMAPFCKVMGQTLPPNGFVTADVYCIPRAAGSNATHVLVGAIPLSHLPPTAITVVCTGIASAGNQYGFNPPAVMLATDVGMTQDTMVRVEVTGGTVGIQKVVVDPGSDWLLLSASPLPPQTLGSGQAIITSLRFHPTAAGQRNGVLRVTTAAGDQTLVLNGIGQQLVATGTPNPLDIKAPQNGTAEAPLTLTGEGAGSATLALTITGDDTITFADNTRNASVFLSPGTSTVGIKCQPTQTMQRSATITGLIGARIALTSPVTVFCTGVAQNQLYSSPGILDFGEVRVGTTKTMSSNVLYSPMIGSAGEATLSSVATFAKADTIARADTTAENPLSTPQEYKITLAPTADAPGYENQLVVNAASGGNSAGIMVTAKFVTASAAVPDEVDLGVVCRGDHSGVDVEFTANGTGHVGLNTPIMQNNNDFDLSLLAPSAYPNSLAVAETARVHINPRDSDLNHDASAVLEWPTDVVNLNGGTSNIATTNVLMNYRVSGGGAGPRRMRFEDTKRYDASESRTATVTNCDAAPLVVTAITISDHFSIDSKAAFTLAKGERKQFAVTFTPEAFGPQHGVLTFKTADAAFDIELDGTNPDPVQADSLYACTCAGGNAATPRSVAPLGLALGYLAVGRRRRKR